MYWRSSAWRRFVSTKFDKLIKGIVTKYSRVRLDFLKCLGDVCCDSHSNNYYVDSDNK